MKRKEFFELWIKALESGEYRQTKGALVKNDGKINRYCCLGVACDVANKTGARILDYKDGLVLPLEMTDFLGIECCGDFEEKVTYRGRRYAHLAELNDSGVKFKTIAGIIREQLASGNFSKP